MFVSVQINIKLRKRSTKRDTLMWCDLRAKSKHPLYAKETNKDPKKWSNGYWNAKKSLSVLVTDSGHEPHGYDFTVVVDYSSQIQTDLWAPGRALACQSCVHKTALDPRERELSSSPTEQVGVLFFGWFSIHALLASDCWRFAAKCKMCGSYYPDCWSRYVVSRPVSSSLPARQHFQQLCQAECPENKNTTCWRRAVRVSIAVPLLFEALKHGQAFLSPLSRSVSVQIEINVEKIPNQRTRPRTIRMAPLIMKNSLTLHCVWR